MNFNGPRFKLFLGLFDIRRAVDVSGGHDLRNNDHRCAL